MEFHCDVLVVGGGLGGVAAARAAADMGRKVILTEEGDWLGGQLTAQAVPPDEHQWIEQRGCTASYRRLRNAIRQYYRSFYPLSAAAAAKPDLNPGQGAVSRLCHEPKIALRVIEDMLSPYLANGTLRIFLNMKPVGADTLGDRVLSVRYADKKGIEPREISAEYVIDASELGDILSLAKIEHSIGTESSRETGEPHAPGIADPLNQQAVSWCYPLGYIEGTDNTIPKPKTYDEWLNRKSDFWPGSQLSWIDLYPHTLEKRERSIFENKGSDPERDACTLWEFRRIRSKQEFRQGFFNSDISLVNWPQIDYWRGPLLGVTPEMAEHHLNGARELSLSFLYWMQTEAPRHDGGQGYPELCLVPDIVGTEDGLAKAVYIRESRRIKAVKTIREQEISADARREQGRAEQFSDSIGIGCYRIDLHPSTGNRSYLDIPVYPFQIPLGAIIPQRVQNLLPGCKNIGTTHITNGCYRLHPVEWNIGEAAGVLASYCLEMQTIPRAVHENKGKLQAYQAILENQFGIELEWPPSIQGISV